MDNARNSFQHGNEDRIGRVTGPLKSIFSDHAHGELITIHRPRHFMPAPRRPRTGRPKTGRTWWRIGYELSIMVWGRNCGRRWGTCSSSALVRRRPGERPARSG